MTTQSNHSVKDRLLLFIAELKVSVRAFEASCGLSNGFVKNISKGIGADKMRSILLRYPQLNSEWLITGEGEMLRASVVQQGDGNNTQQGDGNVYNSDAAYNTLLKIVEVNQRTSDGFIEVVKKSQEQTDNLIAMLKMVLEKK